MARSIPAHVKPDLLRWGRRSARLSLSQAAATSKFDVETLEAWEKGKGMPSIAQLRKLGKAYKRPISVFFLAEPPKGFSPQKEFRRHPGAVPGEESPELIQAIREASYRRQAALELIEILKETVDIIPSKLDPNFDPEFGGSTIRQSLGISWKDQLKWPNPHNALNVWKSAIEAQSILIFQTGTVPINEMRGTCIPDQPLPVVVINSKDAPHGRIFSLIHEYAHILFHSSGHQTSRMEGNSSPEQQPLEVAANAFAAAALLPREEFLFEAGKYPGAIEGNDKHLRLLAQRVKVSPEAVLRRLVKLGHASEKTYQKKREDWGSKVWYVKQTSGGPIPQSVKVIARAGKYFTGMVLDAYDRHLISTSNASDFLGTKPIHFSKIREELGLGGMATGP